jgi:D-amino-acid dehydrogenase
MTAVAVIGAGVIGMACALRLAAAGHSVALLDPAAPGSGASHGNAGTIADYAVLPVGTPAVLRAIPSLLFDGTSPFAMHRGSLLSLVPWLARFLHQSLPGPARRNAAALAALLAGAGARWRTLAAEIGATRHLRDTGCLYLHATPKALAAARADAAARRALGAAAEVIDAAALAALEPGLPPFAGATLFPGTLSLADPGAVMARLHAACLRAGVEVIASRIDEIERVPVGLLLKGPGFLRTFRRAVIAAGAQSRRLAAQAGDRVPLDTERGYHLEWDMPAPRLLRPCCPVARGFYLAPMAGRLRAVGTVELGGLDAPPSPHRLARIAEGARAVFPDLGAPDRRWMGLRPSLPDSLPVLGPARGGADVIHAFGHGHLGLTLAPVTAEAVAAWTEGRDPGPAFAACRPGRF